MKHVEISDLISAVPVRMTRKEKLLRWAKLIRDQKCALALYSNLEHMSTYQLQVTMVTAYGPSAFSIAVVDPEFAAQGLRPESSVRDVLTFFEMTVNEAHVFSCDCGGYIDNKEQARRIEGLAR
jgi:hypothetical protein